MIGRWRGAEHTQHSGSSLADMPRFIYHPWAGFAIRYRIAVPGGDWELNVVGSYYCNSGLLTFHRGCGGCFSAAIVYVNTVSSKELRGSNTGARGLKW